MQSPLIDFFKNIPVDYRILHNPQQLYSSVYSDLDIVIPKSKLKEFENYLLNNNFIKPIQLLYRKNGYYFITEYIEDGETIIIPIDVIDDYLLNNVLICSNEEFFIEEKYYRDLKCVSEKMELRYLITKKIFKGTFTLEQKEVLKKLINIDESKLILNEIFGNRIGAFLYNSILNDNWNNIENQIKRIKRVLKYRLISKHTLRFILENLREVNRIIYRIKETTGFMLVVMGSDGSGKSTLILNLLPKISPYFRGTIKYHLKPSILKNKIDAPPVIDPHSKNPWPFPISYIKLFYFIVGYIIGYYFKVKLKLIRSNLVVFDRYYDDIIVDKLRYRYEGSNKLLEIFRIFIPKPDLYLLLDAPEDIILKRKAELNINTLKKQRVGYIKIQSQLEYAKILDATKNIEQLVDEATEIISDMLYSRYLTRRKKMFENNTKVVDQISSSSLKYLRFKLKDGREYLIPKLSKLYKNFNIYNPQNVKGRLVKYIYFKFPFLKISNLMLKSIIVNEVKHSDLHIDELNELMLDIFGNDKYYYIIGCGTPGAGQKPVIQVTNSNGKSICYIKVGHNLNTINSLKNESNFLKTVKNKNKKFNVPEVLYECMINDNYLLFLEPISVHKSFRGKISSRHIDIMVELFEFSNYEEKLVNSTYFKHLSYDINSIKSVYYRSFALKELEKVLIELDNRNVRFCLNHGDFCPWNMSYKNDRLYIFDWESASFDLPAGYDYFHFIVQYNSLIKKSKLANVFLDIENYFNNNEVNSYLSRIGISKRNYSSIFKLYLLHKLVYYSIRENDIYKIHKYQTLLIQIQ